MTAYRTNIRDSEPKVVIRNLLTTFGNFFSVLSFAILCFRWSLFSPQLFLFVYLYFFQHVRSVLREFLRMKKNRVLIRCHYSRRGYLSPSSLRHFIEKLSLKNKIYYLIGWLNFHYCLWKIINLEIIRYLHCMISPVTRIFCKGGLFGGLLWIPGLPVRRKSTNNKI